MGWVWRCRKEHTIYSQPSSNTVEFLLLFLRGGVGEGGVEGTVFEEEKGEKKMAKNREEERNRRREKKKKRDARNERNQREDK